MAHGKGKSPSRPERDLEVLTREGSEIEWITCRNTMKYIAVAASPTYSDASNESFSISLIHLVPRTIPLCLPLEEQGAESSIHLQAWISAHPTSHSLLVTWHGIGSKTPQQKVRKILPNKYLDHILSENENVILHIGWDSWCMPVYPCVPNLSRCQAQCPSSSSPSGSRTQLLVLMLEPDHPRTETLL